MNKISLYLVIAALFLCPIHAENKGTTNNEEKKRIEIPWEKIKISDQAKKKLKEISLDFDQVMKEVKEAASIFELNLTEEELKKKDGFQNGSVKGEKNIVLLKTPEGITAEYVFIRKKLHKVGGLMRQDKKVKYVLTAFFECKDDIDCITLYSPEKDYEIRIDFTHKKGIKVDSIDYTANYNKRNKTKDYRIKFKENGDVEKISHVK